MKVGLTRLASLRLQPKTSALLLILVLIVTLTSCTKPTSRIPADEAEKISIAVTPWPASAAVYVAHEKGYFRDEGLQETLREYPSGHLGLADLFTGKIDVATCGDTSIARAAVNGKPAMVVATLSEIDRAILIIARNDRNISKPDDFIGKRVGRVKGTSADFFLHIYLTTSYIDQKDVHVVDLEPDEVVEALVNGRVDAVSTCSPFTIQLRDRLGGNAVVLEEPNFYTMTWNAVAKKEFTEKRPETVKRFLRAIIRANSYIKDDPAEARAISAKYIGTDSPLYAEEWKNYDFTAELDQSLIVNLEDQARWMVSSGDDNSAQRTHDFADHVYADGLKAIRPGAVRMVGR
ncbi:MAG: hypothetical protein A2074_04285 [Candidatus Aquicultor primus]|uniref:Solute-binding protein family 3/N-terminal domain-containing protein n=1 Tax=Candidatus Aquicultor primus TaxID=1797195 RepID=A0A1F2UNV7_9ACTN|nr:MAG: hypothetical protein A2074_04285 [Candidatus Aquicultor primus]